MNIEKVKKRLKNQIAKSNLNVLDWLQALVSSDSKLYNEITILKSQLEQLNEQSRLNIQSSGENITTRNKIIRSTIELVDKLTIEEIISENTTDLNAIVNEFRLNIREENYLSKSYFQKIEKEINYLKAEIGKIHQSIKSINHGKENPIGDLMPKPWKIFLSNYSDDNISVLLEFTQELHIKKENNILSLLPLQYFKELKKIHFQDLSFSDFSVLKSLSSVKEIIFENCINLNNLAFVSMLQNLETLRIIYDPQKNIRIIDLEDLKNSKAIKFIRFEYARVVNFDFLEKLDSLSLVELDSESYNEHSKFISRSKLNYSNIGSRI